MLDHTGPLPGVGASVLDMSSKTVPPFTAGQLEALCRELGEAMTGSQMDRLLPAASIADISQQSTKWKRLYESLASRQNQDSNANAVCRFIKVAMAPERFGSEPERFEAHREGLNLTLGFVGLELRENGKLYPAAPTTTLTEAQERANALKTKLRERNVHPDVLAFCRAGLVQRNYFHAVFEATKSVADKIRTRTGLKSDGGQLVDDAFGIKGRDACLGVQPAPIANGGERAQGPGDVGERHVRDIPQHDRSRTEDQLAHRTRGRAGSSDSRLDAPSSPRCGSRHPRRADEPGLIRRARTPRSSRRARSRAYSSRAAPR